MLRSILSRSARMWSAVALAGVAGAAAVVLAQAPVSGGQQASPPARGNAQAAPMERGRMQMMMQREAQSDQRLDALVTKMNAARGDQKVAAIAEVVGFSLGPDGAWHLGRRSSNPESLQFPLDASTGASV